MKNRSIFILTATVLTLCFLGSLVWAAPFLINYQGKLTSPAGEALEGSYEVAFRIYDAAAAGNLLWEETQPVSVQVGIFNVLLGAGLQTPGTADFNHELFIADDRWLAVVVNAEEMEPRQRITSVAYAFQAEEAGLLDGHPASDFLSASGPSEITGASDGPMVKVINTTTGDGIDSYAAGDMHNGVYAYAAGNGGHGMLGVAGGDSGNGIHGLAINSASIGVYGEGPTGVKGESETGSGVVGHSTAVDGNGVFGNSTQGVGVRGQSDYADGVVGWSGAADKSGVNGYSELGTGVSGRSTNNDGIFGASFSTDPANAGIYGKNNGAGTGVRGETNSEGEWTPAIYGKNDGAGDGVSGWSKIRHGVYGVTSSPNGQVAGVYGINNGSGPAVKADGRLEITGETIASGKVYANDELAVYGAFTGNVGNNGAPFPKPAFVSEWFDCGGGGGVALGVDQILPPSQYARSNFVVDLQCSYPGYHGYGPCFPYNDGRGYYVAVDYDNKIYVLPNIDQAVTKVRVRVWYYR
jgi:hypothetical protein